MSTPAPDLASLLRAARLDPPPDHPHLRGPTLEGAAALTGCSLSSLARYEAGHIVPPLPVLRGILAAYQSPPDIVAACEAAWVLARPGSADRGTP